MKKTMATIDINDELKVQIDRYTYALVRKVRRVGEDGVPYDGEEPLGYYPRWEAMAEQLMRWTAANAPSKDAKSFIKAMNENMAKLTEALAALDGNAQLIKPKDLR